MDKPHQSLLTFADSCITKLKYHQKYFLFLAVVIVIISVFLIIKNNPSLFSELSLIYVFYLVIAGIPLTIFQNTWRYRLSAALLNINISWLKSLQIAVMTTIANLLPLPGGILVKVGGLRAHSASYKDATKVTIHTAYIWASCTIVITGLGFMGLGKISIGFPLIIIGIAVIYLSWKVLCIYQGNRTVKQNLFLNHTLASLIYSFRLYLCLLALGADITFSQAAALPLAPIVASAIVFVPGGLGVQEATAALLGALIGLPPEKVFIAGLINRFFGLTENGIIAGILLYTFTNNSDSEARQ